MERAFFLNALLLLLFSFFIFSSCTKKEAEPPGPSAKKGKATYQAYCTACHNADPKKEGTIGPDIFGSSKDLIRSKVLTSDYPKDYPNPKRKTHAMAALPHLEPEIDSIHLYLNSSE